MALHFEIQGGVLRMLKASSKRSHGSEYRYFVNGSDGGPWPTEKTPAIGMAGDGDGDHDGGRNQRNQHTAWNYCERHLKTREWIKITPTAFHRRRFSLRVFYKFWI